MEPEPEPEPQPQPARQAESRAEGKARTKMQGLSARLEACTPPAAAEGAKQGKKGRKGQKPSSRPPPLSAQEAKQWLEAVSAVSTLTLPTTSDGLEAAAGADGEQAPWAAEYFALLQRVVQSGPLAGPKPGRFRKAKPPREHAEAAVTCLTSAVEADRAAEGRLLTEPQRAAIAYWLRDAERYFEKTADGKPSNTSTAVAGAAAANPQDEGDRELAALAEGASGEGSSAAAAAERLRGNVAATMRTDGRKPRW